MKVIIAGSRTLRSFADVCIAMGESGWISQVTEIVSGGAHGADRLGELWARTHNKPVRVFAAQWPLGRHAGLRRNVLMAKYADALVAIWDGNSAGTKHMIGQMRKLKKPVYVLTVRPASSESAGSTPAQSHR